MGRSKEILDLFESLIKTIRSMRGQYLLQTASTRELLCGEWERKDSTVSFRIYIEDGKYYTVMDVRRRGSGDADQAADALKGADQADGNAQDAASASGLSRLSEDSRMLYGDYLIRTKNSVLLTYLKEEEEKLARFIGDLSAKAGSSERAAERLSELKVQLRENQEVQHEMQGDH